MKDTLIAGPQLFRPKFSEVSISNKFAGSRQQHHEGWPDEGVKVFLQAIRIVVQSLQTQPLSRRVQQHRHSHQSQGNDALRSVQRWIGIQGKEPS